MEIFRVNEKEVKALGIKVQCLPKDLHIYVKSNGSIIDLCSTTELDEVWISYDKKDKENLASTGDKK